MSELALRLIEENKYTQAKTLDLSNCGMTEIPSLIIEMGWIEELIICGDAYYDFEKKAIIATKNGGGKNNFSRYLLASKICSN